MSLLASLPVVLSLAGALPPHPLDEVIGADNLTAEAARDRIVRSGSFRRVIDKALKEGRTFPHLGVTYAQRVRVSIGRQLSAYPDLEHTDARTLPAHPLDAVIGEIDRPEILLQKLSTSPEFLQVVRTGIAESDGAVGHNFGSSVRARIADQLYPPANRLNRP